MKSIPLQRYAERTAIISQSHTLTYGELDEAVSKCSDWIITQNAERVALLLDNSVSWIIFDLACQRAGSCLIPVPPYFTPAQMQHLLTESRAQYLICMPALEFEGTPVPIVLTEAKCLQLADADNPALPENTGKITFTSGSTGAPKGVCLSHSAQLEVAQSLVDKLKFDGVRHLCLLPLATLLENIAGVYAPLLVGGTVILADGEARGFTGTQLTHPERLLGLISTIQPQTLILVPELLQLLLAGCQSGWVPPASLRFIAVGGARVSGQMLTQAANAGLPVYQGYGLSEAVSVNTLNIPGDSDVATAGAPLGHTTISVEDGEVVVSGNIFLGYLDDPESFYPQKVHTGDRGALKDGRLIIQGRNKNLLINSFGRNISPEWVESELLATGVFRQVFVEGDSRPFCIALLVPAAEELTDEQLGAAVSLANQQLPDYAQVKRWKRVPHFTAQRGQVTANGKLKREAINVQFSSDVNALYDAPDMIRTNTMPFYNTLQQATRAEREQLVSAPIIQRCFNGDIAIDDYVAFLQQAYHHVKHTVPLLMATGAALPESKEWLREAVGEYIEEEMGHQEWVLNDIAACGVDKEAARNSTPSVATELMVAYAYDAVRRVNPLCFFGMVFVLEGTSIALADLAAGHIKDKLSLPANAFSYLRSHGSLDQDHIVFFEGLMNKITDPDEQALIIHSAKVFFKLYGDIFRTLTPAHGLAKVA